MAKFCEVCQAHKDNACFENLFSDIDFLHGDEIADSKNGSCDLILEKDREVIFIEHKIREWFSCFYDSFIDTKKQEKNIRIIRSKINGSLLLVNTENKKVLCFLAFSKKVRLPVYEEDSPNTRQAKERVNQIIQKMDASYLKIYIQQRLFSQLAPKDNIHFISDGGKTVFLDTGECSAAMRFLY